MKWKLLSLTALLTLTSANVFAESLPQESSIIVSSSDSMDMESFNAGVTAMEQNSWQTAFHHFDEIRHNFPHSAVFDDALYFQAVCNYHLREYNGANKMLTEYLGSKYKLKFFEDALAYKLEIANKYRDGAKKHLFDYDKFPKWLPAREDALEIYDEIIGYIPNHDLAAQAYYEKGSLLKKMQDYKTSLECFQTLIKKFPKHPLTPDSYLAINEAYYEQSHSEFHNTDLLELAVINLKKFTQNFPRDEKVEKAKYYYEQMREIHAKGLYDIGMFYERTHKPKASVIYYVTALEKFPESPSAALCKDRLAQLENEMNDLQVSKEILK